MIDSINNIKIEKEGPIVQTFQQNQLDFIIEENKFALKEKYIKEVYFILYIIIIIQLS